MHEEKEMTAQADGQCSGREQKLSALSMLIWKSVDFEDRCIPNTNQYSAIRKNTYE